MNKFFKTLNTTFFGLIVTLFVLSLSISLPLFIRQFYYWHIDLYNIVEITGVSKENLILSFNELMDSLMFFKPFSEGVFPFSEEGKSHFLDCQVLFVLDYVVLIFSFVLLVIYLIALRKNKNLIYRPFNMSISVIMLFIPLLLIGALGTYALIDLNGAYTFFHKIFFPGKSNRVFDVYKDPIIKALPQEFFINCGILILGSYLTIYLSILIFNIKRKITLGGSKVYYAKGE